MAISNFLAEERALLRKIKSKRPMEFSSSLMHVIFLFGSYFYQSIILLYCNNLLEKAIFIIFCWNSSKNSNTIKYIKIITYFLFWSIIFVFFSKVSIETNFLKFFQMFPMYIHTYIHECVYEPFCKEVHILRITTHSVSGPSFLKISWIKVFFR